MPKTTKPPYVSFDDISVGDNISDQSKSRMEGVSDEFALSIDAEGLLEPLGVREGGPSKTSGKRKAVLDYGYRRYGAIKRLRAGEVPGAKRKQSYWNDVSVVWVKGNAQDQDTRNLVENLQRLNLDPYEEAAAMQAYLDKHGVTQSSLADRIGKSEPYVSQRLSILKSTVPEVREALRAGVITPTHVREISALPKDKQADFVAKLREQASQGEYSSVADVKDDIAAGGAPKARKKTGRKGATFDAEKISAAKEAYADKKFAPRPRPAVIETLGTLVIRERRNPTEKTTHQIHALEFVLGIRDSL